MQSIQVHFYTNASKLCGLGHLKRCIFLAQQLDINEYKILFLANNYNTELFIKKNSNFNVLGLLKYTQNPKFKNIFVVDTYESKDLELFKKYIKTQNLITIYDGQKNYLDSKVYLTFGGTYNNLISNSDSKYYSGINFIPIRKEILKIPRKELLTDLSGISVIVYTGFNENSDIVNSVLSVLKSLPFVKEIYTLKFVFKKSGGVFVKLGHQLSIEEVLERVHLAISSSGVILWELTWLRLPTIYFKMSNNQHNNFNFLGVKNLGLQFEFNSTYTNLNDLHRLLINLLKFDNLTKIFTSQSSFTQDLQFNFFPKIIEDNF